MALPAHAPLIVKVRFKYGCQYGYFTIQAETVFRPYLASHCSGVSGIWDMALRTNALRAVQVRMKLVSHEGYFSV
jgi:hypothetical protein